MSERASICLSELAGFIKDLSQGFAELDAILLAIENNGADHVDLARAGRRISTDLANLADVMQEDILRGGILVEAVHD
jgi:hypothetical protein